MSDFVRGTVCARMVWVCRGTGAWAGRSQNSECRASGVSKPRTRSSFRRCSSCAHVARQPYAQDRAFPRRALVDPNPHSQSTQISSAPDDRCARSRGGSRWYRPPLMTPRARSAGRLLVRRVGRRFCPQTLSSLGALFAFAAGRRPGCPRRFPPKWIPSTTRSSRSRQYTVGMALFTMCDGQMRCAFPVMTAAIGLPVIVGHSH